MTRMLSILAGAAIVASGLAIPLPAMAQDAGMSEIVVYGTDACPRSTDDQVVVCARKPESDRYRIPEKLRSSGPRQSRDAWANRARQLETVGATGINSCSPVGPAGFTGCLTQVVNQARRERREDTQDTTAPQL